MRPFIVAPPCISIWSALTWLEAQGREHGSWLCWYGADGRCYGVCHLATEVNP